MKTTHTKTQTTSTHWHTRGDAKLYGTNCVMASVSRSRSLPAVLKLAVGQVGGEREREREWEWYSWFVAGGVEAAAALRLGVELLHLQAAASPTSPHRDSGREWRRGGWFFFLLDLVFGRASVQAVGFVAKILPIPKIVSPVFLISKKLAFSNYLAQLVDTTLVAKQIIA